MDFLPSLDSLCPVLQGACPIISSITRQRGPGQGGSLNDRRLRVRGADPDSGGAGGAGSPPGKEVMTELDEQIDMALPRRLTLDLSGLSFTDSSGIAVLIRVSRRMEQIKGELIVRGVPPQPWKVFQAAGLHKLIRFEQEEPAAAGRRTYINEGGKLRRAGIFPAGQPTRGLPGRRRPALPPSWTPRWRRLTTSKPP